MSDSASTAPEAPVPLPSRHRENGSHRLRDRKVLMVALSLLGLLALGGVVGIQVLQSRLNSNIERFGDPFAGLPTRPADPTPDPTAPPDEPKPVNILMVGSDSRISAGDPNQWAAGAQRTDAIMLVHIPADRSGASLFSIPRDSWVDIPGHGQAKINAAFSYGGPTLLIQTVEQLTDIRIDHLVITDFESFKTLTDELGGVEITVPKDTYDHGTLAMKAGTHLLNGDQALVYVRERYGLPRGDFDRVQRQQNWMRAIFTRAMTQNTLTNPGALLSLLTAVTRSVAVDDEFNLNEMRDLALSMKDVRGHDVGFYTVPVTGTGRSPDGKQSIVVLNRPAFDQLMAAVKTDKVNTYVLAHSKDLDTLTGVVH